MTQWGLMVEEELRSVTEWRKSVTLASSLFQEPSISASTKWANGGSCLQSCHQGQGKCPAQECGLSSPVLISAAARPMGGLDLPLELE